MKIGGAAVPQCRVQRWLKFCPLQPSTRRNLGSLILLVPAPRTLPIRARRTPNCFRPKPAPVLVCLKTTKNSCNVFHR